MAVSSVTVLGGLLGGGAAGGGVSGIGRHKGKEGGEALRRKTDIKGER